MADQKYYWLTESDRQLLDVLAQERRRVVRLPRHESANIPSPSTPETYVARTPITGIPALTEVSGADSEDVPGYAECRIYQIIRDTPEANPRMQYLQDEDRTVYNLFLAAFGGNRWVPVTRDKFGRWIALAIFPFPSETDPTGDPTYSGTGTGTGGTNDDIIDITFPPNPRNCGSFFFEETDVFCESYQETIIHTGGGLGTGTGTDLPPNPEFHSLLNLYKRRTHVGFNLLTGCLEKYEESWRYVRTIGCCDPTCVEPDTGTGIIDETAAACCPDGSLYESLDFDFGGPIGPSCADCLIQGTLTQTTPPDGLEWTLGGSGTVTGCNGRTFLTLTIYCSGTSWRAKGRVRRYIPFVEDTTQVFDVALAQFGVDPARLLGSIPISGCSNAYVLVTNPCYSYDCVDGDCTEVGGETGEYATIEECEVGCSEPTIDVDCCVNLLPTTLTATVSAKTGTCTCLPDSFTLVWNVVTTQWESGAVAGCTGSPTFEFDCGMGGVNCSGFRLSSTICNFANDVPEAGCNCDPLLVAFNVTLTSCCTGTATITITE